MYSCIALNAVAQTKDEAGSRSTDLEPQEAINQLKMNAPTQKIREAAARLLEVYKAVEIAEHAEEPKAEGGKGIYNEAGDNKYARHRLLESETAKFAATVRKTPLKAPYQQPAFQCLNDFNICQKGENTKIACGGVLVVCLAKGIIPGTG